MVTAKALIEKFQFALENAWGYIWGAYGQLWTSEKQASATDEKARLYGEKWIGHHVADCSGLGYWAFSELGGFIVHGSNTIWNEYTTDHSELKNGQRTDGKPLFPGDPVFLKKIESGKVNRHHIGYYVGGDTVIEAKGTQWGVVTSPLSRWHETARWYNVLYDNGAYYPKLLTLKRGMRGEQVRLLQETLNELPAGAALDLKVDGIFGAETEKAVRQFQADKGLTVDGVVGKKTWSALGVSPEIVNPPADNGNNEAPEQPPTICIPYADWLEIKAAISAAYHIVKKYEGVE
jgi:hypothetical protein